MVRSSAGYIKEHVAYTFHDPAIAIEALKRYIASWPHKQLAIKKYLNPPAFTQSGTPSFHRNVNSACAPIQPSVNMAGQHRICPYIFKRSTLRRY